jgi:hypothetical protein
MGCGCEKEIQRRRQGAEGGVCRWQQWGGGLPTYMMLPLPCPGPTPPVLMRDVGSPTLAHMSSSPLPVVSMGSSAEDWGVTPTAVEAEECAGGASVANKAHIIPAAHSALSVANRATTATGRATQTTPVAVA